MPKIIFLILLCTIVYLCALLIRFIIVFITTGNKNYGNGCLENQALSSAASYSERTSERYGILVLDTDGKERWLKKKMISLIFVLSDKINPATVG